MGENALTIHGNSFRENKQIKFLKEKLENVKNQQGFIGNLWNGFKELTTLGVSVSDCESMLQKYNSGKISFEEAVEYINNFEKKQENVTDLAVNIGTGAAAIAATAGMASAPLLAIGAGVGAIVKTGIKFLDKSTNNIKNDEYNLKSIVKDGISGAITGTTSAIPSSFFKGKNAAVSNSLFKNGFKCGLACGSAAGFASYMTDVAFDDKEFDLKECAKTTLLSGAISAPIGGIVTAGTPSLAGGLTELQRDMASSTAKKVMSFEVKNM